MKALKGYITGHKRFRCLWVLPGYRHCNLLWRSLSQRWVNQVKKSNKKEEKRYILAVHIKYLCCISFLYLLQTYIHTQYSLPSYFLQTLFRWPSSLCGWARQGDSLLWGSKGTGRRWISADPDLKLYLWVESALPLLRTALLVYPVPKLPPSSLGQIETQTGGEILSFFSLSLPCCGCVRAILQYYWLHYSVANCTGPRSTCLLNNPKSWMVEKWAKPQ